MSVSYNEYHSFCKKKRLLKPKEYSYVFEKPYKISSGYFVILYRPNKLTYSRLGLVISKRRLALSVQRNRVKRLIRESFRLHQKKLIGLDIIVLANTKTATVSNELLYNRLDKKWIKLVGFSKK